MNRNPSAIMLQMDVRDGWQERLRDIRADGATWWWWWYILNNLGENSFLLSSWVLILQNLWSNSFIIPSQVKEVKKRVVPQTKSPIVQEYKNTHMSTTVFRTKFYTKMNTLCKSVDFTHTHTCIYTRIIKKVSWLFSYGHFYW